MSESTQLESTWRAVDRALEQWLAPEDAALRQATEGAVRAGLPEIAVSPTQGRLLEVLSRAVGATRILEIGTLAGYSAIWLARALPEHGALVSIEVDPDRARLALAHLAQAGHSSRVEVKVGRATEMLDAMIDAGTDPFDFIFIDADKESCAGYLERAVALAHRGTVIVVDNIVRRGRVTDGATGDPSVDGVRAMMDLVGRHPQLRAAGMQTVGAKGYDGMLIALVDGPPSSDAGTSDPLSISLQHNVWATREVLAACKRLSDPQWHQQFAIGLGSLHDTLTHIIGAMFDWTHRIDGPSRAARPSIEDGTQRTPAELIRLLDEAAGGLDASARRARARG
ncbi:MAG: DinB family protein, partial [Candidatus Limnocylindrus sp.]